MWELITALVVAGIVWKIIDAITGRDEGKETYDWMVEKGCRISRSEVEGKKWS